MIVFIMAAVAADAATTPVPPGQEVQIERKLDEDIIVNGQRPTYRAEVVQVGAFRNQSILDTPATVAVVSRALLDAQGATGLEEALRNTPGITQQSTSPTTSNNFVSRGVLMNARTNYRLDGSLQVVNLSPVPVENKQRVELLKGVSALYYGISTPSGIVNLVMKRAGERPVNNAYLTSDIEGSYGGGLDLGRKFGADGQLGVRLNGYAAHVETPINGVNGYRYLASGAFDWQATDKLSFKIDLEHYRRATDEPGGISLAAFQMLKTIPNPHTRYAPNNTPYRTWSTNALFRTDYALNDNWAIRAEVGLADSRRQRGRADFSFTSAATVSTGAGTIAGNYTPDQHYRNEYTRGEIAGKINTLGIRHELLLGVARNRQIQFDQNQTSYRSVAQNFYTPIAMNFDSLTTTTTRFAAGSVNIDAGLYAMDIAHVGEKVLLIGGVRRVIYDTENVNGSGKYTMTAWTPTGGVVFKPTPKSSLYFTYIEGLESAGTAPDGTVNQGAILAPQVSRQIEAGARAELRGVMASIAYFHINRALAYADLVTTSPTYNTYLVNGRAVHQGVEASLQGNITPNLSASLGGQYLRAIQENTGTAAQNGKLVTNTPRWSGSVFVEYRPPVIPHFGINGGAYYTGQQYADANNLYVMPGYTTFSLGANYKVPMAGKRALMLRVNADNLTDKRYWATGGTIFYVGLARQVRFSASFDF